MGLELPAVSAVMARLPDPKLSLAAYGGVVFPMALLIESPIIMLLAASTALVRDEISYRVVRRFMFTVAGTLTALHALVAFTPLFDLLVAHMLGVPPEIREPARLGLRIMLPWTLSIAFRRTQQGVMIRHGDSRAVTIGTVIRLGMNALILGVGMLHGGWPGIVIGCTAVVSGVVAEAVYAGVSAAPVVRRHILGRPARGTALTLPAFLHFYLPLMATPFINFLAMPLASAAMSRMPLALDSLAVWPALNGLTFALRSMGFAFNEVVVSQLDRWRPVTALRRFAMLLGLATSGLLVLMALSPLGMVWFARVSGLPPALAAMGAGAFVFMIPQPFFAVWQSLFQGALLHSRRTRGVTESVAAMLVAMIAVLCISITLRLGAGLFAVSAAFVFGNFAQTGWLWVRGRAELSTVAVRDFDPA
ncbi:MAG: hypothetical protein ABIU54_00155 [Candidatus Eisenbacteria bacterium]